MKCPKCGGYTKVYDKRWWPTLSICGQNLRSRKCDKCGFKFQTAETYTRPIGGEKNERLL